MRDIVIDGRERTRMSWCWDARCVKSRGRATTRASTRARPIPACRRHIDAGEGEDADAVGGYSTHQARSSSRGVLSVRVKTQGAQCAGAVTMRGVQRGALSRVDCRRPPRSSIGTASAEEELGAGEDGFERAWWHQSCEAYLGETPESVAGRGAISSAIRTRRPPAASDVLSLHASLRTSTPPSTPGASRTKRRQGNSAARMLDCSRTCPRRPGTGTAAAARVWGTQAYRRRRRGGQRTHAIRPQLLEGPLSASTLLTRAAAALAIAHPTRRIVDLPVHGRSGCKREDENENELAGSRTCERARATIVDLLRGVATRGP
ncbi:hypothetical protein K438DRAFT_1776389 [Mycena galopus ATCC 62051]|nr:hypothetical protein K438DRAFT_1776389 [Mycena galopus ATCC 62051]